MYEYTWQVAVVNAGVGACVNTHESMAARVKPHLHRRTHLITDLEVGHV